MRACVHVWEVYMQEAGGLSLWLSSAKVMTPYQAVDRDPSIKRLFSTHDHLIVSVLQLSLHLLPLHILGDVILLYIYGLFVKRQNKTVL